MKKNGAKKNTNEQSALQRILVEFVDSTATKVEIAGTFNDWRPAATQMIAVGDGKWFKELNLPPGTYEYLFVADGKWVPDLSAERFVPNPFGGMNSVMTVSEIRRQSRLHGHGW